MPPLLTSRKNHDTEAYEDRDVTVAGLEDCRDVQIISQSRCEDVQRQW